MEIECDSVKSVEQKIRDHEIGTCYRYSTYQCKKEFGITNINTARKVYWRDWPSVKFGRQEFSGTPFVVLNKKVYDCHFGKDRKSKRKQRKKKAKSNAEKDYELYVKKPGSKVIVQDTRKIDCPAQVMVREICRFPTYQISADASHFELEATAEDLLARIQNQEQIPYVRVFILILPDNSVHTCHKPGVNAPEDIDPRLAKKIKEMTEAGVRDVEGMKSILKSYVADICTPLPDPSSHRFYPRDKIISNHIYEANKGRQQRQEQESISSFVQEWKTRNPDDFIYCRLKSVETSKLDENDNIEFGATFLFVFMSSQQRRLLQRYGRMAFLDATYKSSMYDLPLFFIAVRTNCGYQVVAAFLTESETVVAISEVLQLIQGQCPFWEPAFFMTDFQESEILAIETVFRGASVLLCDVHRNRAWDRWCRKKENCKGMGSDMLGWLMRLGKAPDETHFAQTLSELQKSGVWTENQKFQQYVERTWLPEKKRWSKAFRTGLIDIVAGTNNGLESMHKVLKSKFLKWKTTYSLSMLLKILLEDFFPASYQKYADQNTLYSGCFRQYSEDIPHEIQKRPRAFVEHCLKGIGLSKSISRSGIQLSGSGPEFVIKGDNKDFLVSLGDETSVPNCQCDIWTKLQMPCEHIFAAASDEDSNVQWERISPLYLQSVYCTVDDMKADVVEDTHAEDLHFHEHIQQEQVGEDSSDIDMNVSLNTARVKARESLQVLTAMTYNITDVRKLKDIQQKAEELAEKHKPIAQPPLLPLPKRAEILKNRRQRLCLSKTKKRHQVLQGNVEMVQEIWSDVLGKEYFTTEDEIKADTNTDTGSVVQFNTSSLPHDFILQDHQNECKEVENIWRGGHMETKHVGPFYLTSESIRCIKALLSDEVIDAFLYEMARRKNVRHINCVTMTAIFEGNADIHHGLRSEPFLMDCDTIIGAHNEGGGHWVLIIIHPKLRTIVYLNSLGEHSSLQQEVVLKWFKFLKCRFDLGLERELAQKWHLSTPSHARQMDGSSCGIYTLKFAENYLDHRPLVFNWFRTDVEEARLSLAVFLLSIASVCSQTKDDVAEDVVEQVPAPTKYPKRKHIPKKRSIGCEYTSCREQKIPKKSTKPEKSTTVYCLCKKPNDGKLYWGCDSCDGWFHPSCVGEVETKEPKKYFCPSCKEQDTKDRFISVGGHQIYIQDPDDVEENIQCSGEELGDKDPVADQSENDCDGDDDIQITGDNKTLYQNYGQIMDELKQTVICDNKTCEIEEHKRHHSFCWKFEEFTQHSNRCHNFGRKFVTFEEEMQLTMKLVKDLCITKPDPERSTGTLPIGTLTIVKDGSKLDRVLSENKLFSHKYVQYVMLKDYIVRQVSLKNGWPLEMSELKCQETEVELRRTRKQDPDS